MSKRRRRSKGDAAVAATPRTEITALGGGLEGAERTSRETMTWSPSRLSPDQLINQLKDEADFRGRDMVTNDGYAQGVVDINRDSIVGSQYRLNAQPNWEVLSRILSPAFDEAWAEEYQLVVEERFNLIAESDDNWLDAARRMNFTGMVRLAIAGFVYTGESLSTVEWIRAASRPFSTCIQQISPVRLCNPDNRADERGLRRGVQRDPYGRPVAYWIRLGFPTEWYIGTPFEQWRYVPADKPWGRKQVIHITDAIQPDQTRGLSGLVAVLKTMRMTKRFQEVTLQNAVINASYAATIESELPSEVIAAAMGQAATGAGAVGYLDVVSQYLASLNEYVSGGTNLLVDGAKIPHLYPGTKLNAQKLGTPGGVGTEFEVSLLRHIAAGLGISYEEFARDFSRTNYSSARASMLTTWKHMMARKRFVADTFANAVYALWLEEDLQAGNLPLPAGWRSDAFYEGIAKSAFIQCDWIGAGRGQIDELKETQAAILRVDAGLSTRESEIAKQGGDWRKVFRQLAREATMAADLGLVFSRDAQRDGSTSGQTVMTGEQDDADAAEGKEQEPAAAPPGMTADDVVAALRSAVEQVRPQPDNRRERTVVTKHDERGRILEYERFRV